MTTYFCCVILLFWLGIFIVFTTTFHPTEPYGVHGNSGDKMPKDDGFSEQKPLYVV